MIDQEAIERAERIFTRYVGRPLKATIYQERVHFSPGMGFPLAHTPVIRVIKVKARARNWEYGHILGHFGWVEIDPQQAMVSQKPGAAVITLPPTLFGDVYDEAVIEYEAGLEEIPQDALDAIHEIARLIMKGDMDEWNNTIPAHLVDVIEKYRKEG